MFEYVVAAQVMCFRLQTWLASLAIAKKSMFVCQSGTNSLKGCTKPTSSACIDAASITGPSAKKSKMSSETEMTRMLDESKKNPVPCFIDVFEPGRYFAFGQCEWLLRFTSLRTVCKRAHVTGNNLAKMCAHWLRSEEPGEMWSDFRQANRLPFIYNTCRASLLQRYFLRFAQQMSGAVVAGSYPAALSIHKKQQPLSWYPSDIDIWVATSKQYDEIIAWYEDLLTRVGICAVELDISSPRETDSDYDSHSEDAWPYWELPKHILEEYLKRWFKYKMSTYGPSMQVLGSLQKCTSLAKRCGKRRPFLLRKNVKIRVNLEEPSAKRWWQLIRVVNVVWISMPRNAPVGFSPAAVCSGFDLSCCCVALQVQFDMTSQILFHCGSEQDLAENTMCLLPCSFARHGANVTLQMLRVLKYVNRGFKLIGVAKHELCVET